MFNKFKYISLMILGMATLPSGKKIPLPPVLIASLGIVPEIKTLWDYGHLDVQPAKKSDG